MKIYKATFSFSDIDGGFEKKKTDRDAMLPALAANYRNILKQVGEDPTREGLLDTPMRAAKAMTYFTKGYQETVQEVVKVWLVIVEICATLGYHDV